MAKLSAKSYWQQFGDTPDYVVMFLPDEGFFRAAWEQDPSLVETGVRSRVHVASPTTLIVLLQSIAYGWQQESVAEDAREVLALGRELYERVGVMGGHLTKMGNSLKGAVGAFNETVGSLEKRLLPTARKLEGYVVSDKELPELSPVAEQPQAAPGAGARRAAARDRRRLETQDRADPVDGIEILAMLDREHVAAVGERQADGEVEPVVPRLHRRPVERTGRRAHGGASARGAAVGVLLHTRLVEQRFDAPVRRCLERVPPACSAARVLADLLAPALDHLALACARHSSTNGLTTSCRSRAGGVCLGVRPADDRVRDLGRQRSWSSARVSSLQTTTMRGRPSLRNRSSISSTTDL